MNLILKIHIEDAEIDLDTYFASGGATTIEEAVKLDLELFERGEASLEEVIFSLGGDVTVTLEKVEHETQEASK